MDTFIQLTLNGLTLGCVYALIALGYSLVYGILKLLNFAHGDVYMVGAFIGFGVLNAFGGSPAPSIATLPRVRSRSTTTARARCGSASITRSCSAPKPGSDDAVTLGATVTLSSMKPGPRCPLHSW